MFCYIEIVFVLGVFLYVLGIINFCGNVVIVIDICVCFGLMGVEVIDNLCIVIIEVEK